MKHPSVLIATRRHITGGVRLAAILVAAFTLAGCKSTGVEGLRSTPYRPESSTRSVAQMESAMRSGETGSWTETRGEAGPQFEPGDEGLGDMATRRLKRGDLLIVNLRGIPRPEDIQEQIDERGTITLSHIGSISVEGLTTTEAEDAIRNAFIKGQVYNRITVIVLPQSEEFFVRGEVARQGKYKLSGELTLMQAIAEAGGYTPYAKKSDIRILRGEKVLKFNGPRIEERKDPDPVIQPGDTVVVRRGRL